MKKLLHERLRGIAESEEADCDQFVISVDMKCSDFDSCTNCAKDVLAAIADEIEKYYIPRPRFEDGEPVRVGDSFIQKCINEEVELSKIGIALYTSDCLNMVWFPDEVVPRPAPKVLDADGVEIKVGDTVYSLLHDGEDSFGTRYRVDRLILDDELPVRCFHGTDFGYQFDGTSLTHREPDSLEKLRDDIKIYVRNGWNISQPKAEEFADRLTAIMERDA